VPISARPQDIFARRAEAGIPARGYLTENLADTSIVDLEVAGQETKPGTDHAPDLCEGDSVHVAFASDAFHLFERDGGARRAG